ncbi:M56 family metallopeptidase [Haliea sp. E1-2-M8]|uniref:M56 family metallopeptidase n=1 Tax=Haliea sp. E1-2-M8 TaxID=3064706 RepID=UPI00271B0D29|nr:M56 family metallopeptidase [Haliea sp. E1-2-M8]MDO8862054.1 M56 family metallopeptidase [Haliea sp. E1-2-M8]
MLINEWAIIVNLLSIALIGLLVATVLLASVAPFTARRITQLSAGTQKTTLWLFVVTPWAVSIICMMLFVPSLFQSESMLWLDRLAHWHHPYVFYLDSWHSATLVLFLLGIVYVLVRNGRKAVRHLNALDTLTHLSQGKTGHWNIGRDIVVLASQTPSAFTAGLINPKCYVTTGLIEQVSATELDIIIDHERAHIKHKDTQKKWLFSLFASLYPKPVARRLNRLFSLATEQLADAQVSMSYCTLDIAQTLVKAARIQRFFAGKLHPAMVSYFIADDVDLRVRTLVVPQRFRSFPWGFCLLAMALTTILSTMGIDALHHLIEAVFSH